METAEFLRQLDDDGTRLAAVARAGDLDARVPGLDWSVREVVAHTAGVHGWCADLLRERRTTNETGSAAFAPDPTAADLVDRFAAGVAGLVEVLASTPEDVTGWGFGHQVPLRAFWGRRQMHETAVHRADVERGTGVRSLRSASTSPRTGSTRSPSSRACAAARPRPPARSRCAPPTAPTGSSPSPVASSPPPSTTSAPPTRP